MPLLIAPALLLATVVATAPPEETPSLKVVPLLRDAPSLAAWMQQHSADMRAAQARERQSEAELAQSRLLPSPELQASLGDIPLGTSNPPGLTFHDTAVGTIGLSETVELAKRGPRTAGARLRVDAQHESTLDTLTDAMARARLAIGRVVYLTARQTALDESLASAREILTLSKTRLDHGDLSGTDYDRLLVDTTSLEVDVTRNRTDLDAARQACRAAVFATCDATGAEMDALDETPDGPPAPEAADAVLGARPDLVSLECLREASREDQVLAGRRKIPDPVLSATYTRDRLVVSGDQPRTLTVGVQLTLPVFDRGQHDAERAAAHVAEAEAQLTALRAQARADVAALTTRARWVRQALDALRGRALATAKSVLDATVTAVNQGELSMTDLLLARRTHNDLVLKVMDLQFEGFATRVELRHALGLDAHTGSQEDHSWKTP